MDPNSSRPPYDRSPVIGEPRARLRPDYAGGEGEDPFERYPTLNVEGFQDAVLPLDD